MTGKWAFLYSVCTCLYPSGFSFCLAISCLKISVACPAASTNYFGIEDSTSGGSGGSDLGVLLDDVVFSKLLESVFLASIY